MIVAASGGGLQVSITSGVATSPDGRLGSRVGRVIAVGLGVGDGLGVVTPHALNASRRKMFKRMENYCFIGNLFLIIANRNQKSSFFIRSQISNRSIIPWLIRTITVR